MLESHRAMKDMIKDLRNAGVELSDEQQVLAMICSLPNPEWAKMKRLMNNSENIKTFDDIKRLRKRILKRLRKQSPKEM